MCIRDRYPELHDATHNFRFRFSLIELVARRLKIKKDRTRPYGGIEMCMYVCMYVCMYYYYYYYYTCRTVGVWRLVAR